MALTNNGQLYGAGAAVRSRVFPRKAQQPLATRAKYCLSKKQTPARPETGMHPAFIRIIERNRYRYGCAVGTSGRGGGRKSHHQVGRVGLGGWKGRVAERAGQGPGCALLSRSGTTGCSRTAGTYLLVRVTSAVGAYKYEYQQRVPDSLGLLAPTLRGFLAPSCSSVFLQDLLGPGPA